MTDIIALFYILISLHSKGLDTSDPAFVQKVFTEMQVKGIHMTVDTLEKNLPDLLAEAGIEPPLKTPSEIPPSDTPGTGAKAVDPQKLDYKKELKNLGYYKEDSKNAELNLRNAILRFQSSCNLVVNGKWNSKYLQPLAVRLETGKAPGEDLIVAPPSEGMWLVINKTKRILTLYENDKVLQKYPIAVGNPPSLTVDGKYTIVNKVVNPAWGGGGYAKPVKGGVPENPLGYRWLGLSYKNGNDLGIHGNNSPYSIGKNISHGCIRMINSDVEQLFETVPKSAPVWIGTDALLKEWGVSQNE